ncbi:MAG TPA: hypothetical protein VKB35_01130 [Ktedonobacteraceae bacterium]|nr:hypothetical protein [Ktedonobacteraceae bacterium]
MLFIKVIENGQEAPAVIGRGSGNGYPDASPDYRARWQRLAAALRATSRSERHPNSDRGSPRRS